MKHFPSLNWNVNLSLDEWDGVEIIEIGGVKCISLILSRFNITDAILKQLHFPKDIGHLSLICNELTGALEGYKFPKTIKYLDLSRNQITDSGCSKILSSNEHFRNNDNEISLYYNFLTREYVDEITTTQGSIICA